jgi:DNA-binding Lrp family transcriptional regulator
MQTMKAYVLIDIRTGEIREAVEQLRRVDGIEEAYMTFGIYDAIAVIEAEDLNEMGRIMSSSIQPIPGIVETITCLAVDN